ncbi:MAG: hypothetical protein ACAH80_08875 [Alphaproteobacteria bacterium]
MTEPTDKAENEPSKKLLLKLKTPLIVAAVGLFCYLLALILPLFLYPIYATLYGLIMGYDFGDGGYGKMGG